MNTQSETLPRTMPRTVPKAMTIVSRQEMRTLQRNRDINRRKDEDRFQELADFSKNPQNTKLSKGEYSL